jgi:phosphate transport system permease protein
MRRTSRRVHFVDRLAGMVITIGGISVILTVVGICLFLLASVLPLFRSGEIAEQSRSTTSVTDPRIIATDEYQASMLVIAGDGNLSVLHTASGQPVVPAQPLTGGRVTAMSFEPSQELLAIGREDGQVQLGRAAFETELLSAAEVGQQPSTWTIGQTGPFRHGEIAGVLQRFNLDQFRFIHPEIVLADPAPLSGGSGAVVSIDLRTRGETQFLLSKRADGTMALGQVRTVRPLGGGKPRTRISEQAIATDFAARGAPQWSFITGDGESILCLWTDGYVQRYSTHASEGQPIRVTESVQLIPAGRKVTAASMMLGGVTLLAGDDKGTLNAAFAAVNPAADTPDGLSLVVSHRIDISSHPLTAINISTRDRTLVVGDANGSIHLLNLTSEKRVARAFDSVATPEPIAVAAIAPKMNGVVAISSQGTLRHYHLEPGHPEASVHSLFGKVHYEGGLQPQYTYQSSSGEDTAEPKLSLVPLILGTLKATLFAMLFAAPVAILAAIFTSEFLNPDVRRYVKPAIETMASLPSVVLGFIAAILVAPWVAQQLPSVLLAFFALPFAVLLGAHLWQMVPMRIDRSTTAVVKLTLVTITMAIGIGLASLLAPIIERGLFGPTRADQLVLAGSVTPAAKEAIPGWIGARTSLDPNLERKLRQESGMYFRDGKVVVPVDPADMDVIRAKLATLESAQPSIRTWLDGNYGAVWPGWMAVILPLVAVGFSLAESRLRSRGILPNLDGLPRGRAAAAYMLRFAILSIGTLALSAGLGILIASLGVDSRDFVFGSFSQRNTLIVGLMMGFAVIPIIYTISEDAMRSVPQQLRTASVGAGATPWQTAIRVVLPVAGSGVFSAIMIGLGRATGETMIVVMATGNTPSLDWNLFSGFRTLSANIAVELPEAAQDSSHYRVLFLCGLVLFALTFLVNTTAEIVRQRFRRQNAAL